MKGHGGERYFWIRMEGNGGEDNNMVQAEAMVVKNNCIKRSNERSWG